MAQSLPIFIDTVDDYQILQTSNENYTFKRLIDDFSEYLIGKQAVVLSFDGDSYNPFDEEYERGWKYYQNEVAYSPTLDRTELQRSDVIANCYDEWYLFDEAPVFTENEIFVTFSGFRLINTKTTAMSNISNRFLKRIHGTNPSSFILYGDNFIYGTKEEDEIRKITGKWGGV